MIASGYHDGTHSLRGYVMKSSTVRREYARNYYRQTLAETLITADMHANRWTPEDDRIVLDTSITLKDRAYKLGRTHSACLNRIYKLRKIQYDKL